jgi:hypothetical protein
MRRTAAVTAMLLLAVEPLTAPAQDPTIRKPRSGMTLPVQEPTPGRVVVPVLPPPLILPTPTPRRLEDAPPPEHFIAPGIEGVYAQLRSFKGKNLKEVKLKPYEPYRSPKTPPDPSRFNIRQIVLKFIEGSGVRLRDGALVVSEEPTATETRVRLTRIGLEPARVASELAKLTDVFASFKGLADRAAPGIDELDLQRLRQAAERSTGFEQPDPNLFYFVHLPALRPEDALRVLQTVAQFRSVEVAYFHPIPFDAADKLPQTTLNVFPSQGYLRPAPQGIDVDFARNFSGGRGEGIRIVDIEAGWNIGHEDLPPLFFRYGTNFGTTLGGDHGTAVLGELVAEENAFGATGIVPQAQAGWSSVSGISWKDSTIYFYSVAYALLVSGDALRAGDIALIEQHYPNPPPATCSCMDASGNCNNPQLGFVAMETFPYEHAAISALTGAGIIVVEAAGNGETLVTPASTRDSGAIVVGASNTARAPACFTNFGPRVNVHAWGDGIGTLGYGGIPASPIVVDPALRANGNDPDQWYTSRFGGTSGASPIVVGAAALIQSTRIAKGLGPLTPVAMRSLLASTGTPQVADARNIGPLPNLRAALASLFPDHASFIFQSSAPATPVAPGATFNITVRFQNAGGISWTGGHSVQIAPSQTGPSAFGAQSIALGSASAPIDPNGLATNTFTLQAPSTPGTHALGFWLRDPNGRVLATGPSQQIVVGSAPSDAAALSVIVTPGQLRMGAPGVVTVSAQNTGSVVWSAQTHALRIWNPTQNLTLSQSNISVAGAVAPGQSTIFSFTATCRATGPASYSIQMTGPQGALGAVAGRTVSCTP